MDNQIADVIQVWETADPTTLHPLWATSAELYEASGQNHAALLGTVLPPGCTVIDFGCGDGRVAIPLHDLGYDVLAVDGSQAMLDRLRERDPDLPAILSDGINLTAAIGDQADAAITLRVLDDYDNATSARLIEGLRAAVRIGGLLVIDWPDAGQHAELCAQLGLESLDLRLPWAAFRAVVPA